MVTRAKARWTALGVGLLLVVALRLLPLASPWGQLGLIGLIAVLVAILIALAFVVLRAWLGRTLAVALLVVALATPVALTAIDLPGAIGVRLPCHRNWRWLPSYLPRSSPTRSLRFSVGTVDVKLCYGAPSARGRTMIGGRLPFGRLWRTGANEPTTVQATGPISVAGVAVAGGKAAIYSVPGPQTWEIIVNGSTGQWGIESEYTEEVRAHEIGRSIVRVDSTAAYQEQLTFRAEPRAGDTVEVVLEWERVRVVIPIGPLR